MSDKTFINLLRRQLPAHCILSHPEDLRPYECDALSAYSKLPMVVVIPETLDQVQTLLKLSSDHNVPVVARGAGTGLSGGALPRSDGVLLSLARFNRILDIDTDNRTARVQPGVTNLSISKAAEPYSLYYAPDPSSQIACSIGGNVAENAGGVHCLKYGLTVHNILRLEILTMEGERLTIGSQALDSPGYDLLALMTGSEGLLGVITEITVRLLPKPESARVVLAAFNSVEAAGAAVTATIASSIIPAGLELLDKPAIRAVEKFVPTG
ncbi:MAG: FAD-binding protein, partial [Pseudomonadota bacterium]|nr:FAD-binding protein [Pseudomonadota bacterium]